MKDDTTKCHEENLNSSALKDIINVAGKGGRKSKSTVVGVGIGKGRKGVVGKVLAHKTSKVLKEPRSENDVQGAGSNSNQKVQIFCNKFEEMTASLNEAFNAAQS
ncbi:hypothetical protein ACOSQ2_017749 [Xanthoceras sorbifolium]